MLTAGAVTAAPEVENITVLRNYFDVPVAAQISCWRSSLHDGNMGTFLPSTSDQPNRAEAAVRLLKAQLKIMLSSIKAGTWQAQHLRSRNCQKSDRHVTPLELAFGRRPANLTQLDVATPTQLTIDRNEEELTAIQTKQLSKQAFQEARQSENIRKKPCSEFPNELKTSTCEGRGLLLAGRQIQDSFRLDR